MRTAVDVVILSRDGGPLDQRVVQAIHRQAGVRLHVHRIVGRASPSDRNRWETISRARNSGKNAGRAPWVMFVDDDVQLGDGCIQRLLTALQANGRYGALAADYLRESTGRLVASHVTMGATLFRRTALDAIRFRWEPGACECQCCCRDLRKAGIAIGYAPGEKATHLAIRPAEFESSRDGAAAANRPLTGHVLAAFDRYHFRKFNDRFLTSLRRAGNAEPVTAVAYGLYPSELRRLAYLTDVEVVAKPAASTAVPIRRLADFQEVVSQLPDDAPVGYWDTGDVLFQSCLDPLWQMVQEDSSKLLVVSEPFQHPQNSAVALWTLSIHDRNARDTAFRLMSENLFINSGFVAATAQTMLAYLVEGQRLRHGPDLAGTQDWGDQTALNLYCYLQPRRHRCIDEGWNYCLCGRDPHEYYAQADGTIVDSKSGKAIPVVHGNNKTLEPYWFARGLAARNRP